MLKRFFSILLSILMFVTTIPADCLVAFAVSSGQPTISSGSKYVVSWETISGNKGKLPRYNKNFSNNASGLGSNDLLKKYVYVNTSSKSKSAEREPNSSDVPIYRVSRDYGYTDETTSAKAVVPVSYSDTRNYDDFISACKKDGISLSTKKARMIYYVLQNGLKQFTATSGDTFYKQQLHFLATQCLIWEIEEGKRTGWGNETKYTNATASAYPSNSKSLKRTSSISTSYSHPSSGKNKNTYFWHDYYYTCKATKFNSSYPDYYNEILEAAALQSSSTDWTKSLKYNTGTEKNVAFSSEKAHEMTYSTKNERWERTYTIATPSMLGSNYGKFNTNDIVLPIRYFGYNGVKNVKVHADHNSYTSSLYKTTVNSSFVAYPSTNTSSGGDKKYLNSEVYSEKGKKGNKEVVIRGITNDKKFYLVSFYDSSGTYRYRFVKRSDKSFGHSWGSGKWTVDEPDSFMGVDVANGGSKLTFYTKQPLKNTQTGIKAYWYCNHVSSGYYNKPMYFSGKGGAVKGYVCGGNGISGSVRFNFSFNARQVKYVCKGDSGTDNGVIKTQYVPNGYKIVDTDYHGASVSYVNKNYNNKITEYAWSLKEWKFAGKTLTNGEYGPTGRSITSDTQFDLYLDKTDRVSYIEYKCGHTDRHESLGDATYGKAGTKVNAKPAPTNDDCPEFKEYKCKFKGWSKSTEDTAKDDMISAGEEISYPAAGNSDTYYARYTCNGKITYKCAICKKIIKNTEIKPAGDSHTLTFIYSHICDESEITVNGETYKTSECSFTPEYFTKNNGTESLNNGTKVTFTKHTDDVYYLHYKVSKDDSLRSSIFICPIDNIPEYAKTGTIGSTYDVPDGSTHVSKCSGENNSYKITITNNEGERETFNIKDVELTFAYWDNDPTTFVANSNEPFNAIKAGSQQKIQSNNMKYYAKYKIRYKRNVDFICPIDNALVANYHDYVNKNFTVPDGDALHFNATTNPCSSIPKITINEVTLNSGDFKLKFVGWNTDPTTYLLSETKDENIIEAGTMKQIPSFSTKYYAKYTVEGKKAVQFVCSLCGTIVDNGNFLDYGGTNVNIPLDTHNCTGNISLAGITGNTSILKKEFVGWSTKNDAFDYTSLLGDSETTVMIPNGDITTQNAVTRYYAVYDTYNDITVNAHLNGAEEYLSYINQSNYANSTSASLQEELDGSTDDPLLDYYQNIITKWNKFIDTKSPEWSLRGIDENKSDLTFTRISKKELPTDDGYSCQLLTNGESLKNTLIITKNNEIFEYERITVKHSVVDENGVRTIETTTYSGADLSENVKNGVFEVDTELTSLTDVKIDVYFKIVDTFDVNVHYVMLTKDSEMTNSGKTQVKNPDGSLVDSYIFEVNDIAETKSKVLKAGQESFKFSDGYTEPKYDEDGKEVTDEDGKVVTQKKPYISKSYVYNFNNFKYSGYYGVMRDGTYQQECVTYENNNDMDVSKLPLLSKDMSSFTSIDIYLYYVLDAQKGGIKFEVHADSGEAFPGVNFEKLGNKLHLYSSDNLSSLPTSYSDFIAAKKDGTIREIDLSEINSIEDEKTITQSFDSSTTSSGEVCQGTFSENASSGRMCTGTKTLTKCPGGDHYVEGSVSDTISLSKKTYHANTAYTMSGNYFILSVPECSGGKSGKTQTAYIYEEISNGNKKQFLYSKELSNSWSCNLCGVPDRSSKKCGTPLDLSKTLIVPAKVLQTGKYYFFAIEDNVTDKFYYNNEVTGGIFRYSGKELYYKSEVSLGQQMTKLQIQRRSTSGNDLYSAENLRVLVSKEKIEDITKCTWTCNECPNVCGSNVLESIRQDCTNNNRTSFAWLCQCGKVNVVTIDSDEDYLCENESCKQSFNTSAIAYAYVNDSTMLPSEIIKKMPASLTCINCENTIINKETNENNEVENVFNVKCTNNRKEPSYQKNSINVDDLKCSRCGYVPDFVSDGIESLVTDENGCVIFNIPESYTSKKSYYVYIPNNAHFTSNQYDFSISNTDVSTGKVTPNFKNISIGNSDNFDVPPTSFTDYSFSNVNSVFPYYAKIILSNCTVQKGIILNFYPDESKCKSEDKDSAPSVRDYERDVNLSYMKVDVYMDENTDGSFSEDEFVEEIKPSNLKKEVTAGKDKVYRISCNYEPSRGMGSYQFRISYPDGNVVAYQYDSGDFVTKKEYEQEFPQAPSVDSGATRLNGNKNTLTDPVQRCTSSDQEIVSLDFHQKLEALDARSTMFTFTTNPENKNKDYDLMEALKKAGVQFEVYEKTQDGEYKLRDILSSDTMDFSDFKTNGNALRVSTANGNKYSIVQYPANKYDYLKEYNPYTCYPYITRRKFTGEIYGFKKIGAFTNESKAIQAAKRECYGSQYCDLFTTYTIKLSAFETFETDCDLYVKLSTKSKYIPIPGYDNLLYIDSQYDTSHYYDDFDFSNTDISARDAAFVEKQSVNNLKNTAPLVDDEHLVQMSNERYSEALTNDYYAHNSSTTTVFSVCKSREIGGMFVDDNGNTLVENDGSFINDVVVPAGEDKEFLLDELISSSAKEKIIEAIKNEGINQISFEYYREHATISGNDYSTTSPNMIGVAKDFYTLEKWGFEKLSSLYTYNGSEYIDGTYIPLPKNEEDLDVYVDELFKNTKVNSPKNYNGYIVIRGKDDNVLNITQKIYFGRGSSWNSHEIFNNPDLTFGLYNNKNNVIVNSYNDIINNVVGSENKDYFETNSSFNFKDQEHKSSNYYLNSVYVKPYSASGHFSKAVQNYIDKDNSVYLKSFSGSFHNNTKSSSDKDFYLYDSKYPVSEYPQILVVNYSIDLSKSDIDSVLNLNTFATLDKNNLDKPLFNEDGSFVSEDTDILKYRVKPFADEKSGSLQEISSSHFAHAITPNTARIKIVYEDVEELDCYSDGVNIIPHINKDGKSVDIEKYEDEKGRTVVEFDAVVDGYKEYKEHNTWYPYVYEVVVPSDVNVVARFDDENGDLLPLWIDQEIKRDDGTIEDIITENEPKNGAIFEKLIYSDSNTTHYSVSFSYIRDDMTIYVKQDKPYDISTSIINGTITDSIEKIKPHDNAVIKFAPNDDDNDGNADYFVKSVTVDGVALTEAQIDALKVGDHYEYPFNDITSSHSIDVVCDSYSITTEIVNGTITPSSKYLLHKNATINFKPNDGYFVKTVTVDGNIVYTCDPQNQTSWNNGGHYDFSDIKSDHSVKVICDCISVNTYITNGVITPSKTYMPGEDVNIKFTPNGDYYVYSISVYDDNDQSIYSVTVDKLVAENNPYISYKKGSYFINKIGQTYNIKVECKEKPKFTASINALVYDNKDQISSKPLGTLVAEINGKVVASGTGSISCNAYPDEKIVLRATPKDNYYIYSYQYPTATNQTVYKTQAELDKMSALNTITETIAASDKNKHVKIDCRTVKINTKVRNGSITGVSDTGLTNTWVKSSGVYSKEKNSVDITFKPNEYAYVSNVTIDGNSLSNTDIEKYYSGGVYKMTAKYKGTPHEVAVDCSTIQLECSIDNKDSVLSYTSLDAANSPNETIANNKKNSVTNAVKPKSSPVVNFKPAEGYYVSDVLLNGVSIGEQKVEELYSGGSYMIENIKKNTSLYIKLAKIPTYNIITSIKNGTITPTRYNIDANKFPTYTVDFKPNGGYLVSKIVVDGTAMTDITDYAAGGSLTFTDKKDHTVDVECEAVGVTVTIYLHKDAVNSNDYSSPLSKDWFSLVGLIDKTNYNSVPDESLFNKQTDPRKVLTVLKNHAKDKGLPTPATAGYAEKYFTPGEILENKSVNGYYNAAEFPYYQIYYLERDVITPSRFYAVVNSKTKNSYFQKYIYCFDEWNKADLEEKGTEHLSDKYGVHTSTSVSDRVLTTENPNYNFNIGCYFVGQKRKDITVEFIPPNAPYSYNTNVVSTFRVTNNSDQDFKADETELMADVVLKQVCKHTDEETGKTEFYSYALPDGYANAKYQNISINNVDKTTASGIVVPAHSSTIFSVKFYIPNKSLLYQQRFDETNQLVGWLPSAYLYNTEYSVSSNTPDERFLAEGKYVGLNDLDDAKPVKNDGYNLNGGNSFNYTDSQNDKEYYNTASWEMWSCDNNNNFVKEKFTARLSYDSIALRPYDSKNDISQYNNPTQNYTEEDGWVTKSGYGVQVLVDGSPLEITKANTNSQDLGNTIDLYTSMGSTTVSSTYRGETQSATVYLPEYNFNSADGTYERLYEEYTIGNGYHLGEYSERNRYHGTTIAPKYRFYPFSGLYNVENEDTHLIPIWYPDNTEYKVQVKISDCWTPAGMLSYVGDSNPITVNGSLFEDFRSRETSAY